MPKHGKKYLKAVEEHVGKGLKIDLSEAVDKVVKSSFVKFDEGVDIAMRLGVDPRHADQMVRGTVILPNGTGKDVRVLVFAKGEKEKEALDAGADYVGNDDLVEKIKGGWFEFDKAIATPDMMGTVGKIGRALGPRGLMPNAKTGTVTFDVDKAIAELKSGKIDFRVEKTGIIHVSVGKVSFGVEKIVENATAFIDMIYKLKPASSKGIYVKSLTITSTMGPGFRVDPVSLKS